MAIDRFMILDDSTGNTLFFEMLLKEMGYSNVRNLGGFKGWLEAGGEVEKA